MNESVKNLGGSVGLKQSNEPDFLNIVNSLSNEIDRADDLKKQTFIFC